MYPGNTIRLFVLAAIWTGSVLFMRIVRYTLVGIAMVLLVTALANGLVGVRAEQNGEGT
jgi:hypothetical protein